MYGIHVMCGIYIHMYVYIYVCVNIWNTVYGTYGISYLLVRFACLIGLFKLFTHLTLKLRYPPVDRS